MTYQDRILERRFQSAPRFGHSNSFSDLFSQDEDVANDYIRGLLVSSLMLLSLFIIWGGLLIAFKTCLGPKQVGFLSGAPFQATITNSVEGRGGFINPWIARGRAVFALSCIFFILFSILLVTAGIGNMDTTTTTIGHGALFGYDYFTNARATLNHVFVTLEILIALKNNILHELRDFFADIQIAQNVYETYGDVEAAVGILIQSVEDFEDFLTNPLHGIDSALSNGQGTMESVYTVTDKIDLRGVQAGVGLLMTIFPAFLLFCFYWNVSGAKPNGRLNCFRTWFVWPVFVVLVILSIVFCCGISIAGMMNVDFCSGGKDQSPDSTIIEILDKRGTDPNSFDYKAVVYLVNECNAKELVRGTPLEDVEDLKSEVELAIDHVAAAIEEIISTGIELLTKETGHNVTLLTDHLEEFKPSLETFWPILGEFINSLACRPLFKVYSTVTHQATCSESYTGTFWIFMSLLFTSFFGLMAITFRSALYPVAEAEDTWDLELKEQELAGSGCDNDEPEQSKQEMAEENDQVADATASVDFPEQDAQRNDMLIPSEIGHQVENPDVKKDAFDSAITQRAEIAYDMEIEC